MQDAVFIAVNEAGWVGFVLTTKKATPLKGS